MFILVPASFDVSVIIRPCFPVVVAIVELSPEDLVRLRDEVESECRKKLGYAFPAGESGHGSGDSPYEYSMGQGLSDYKLTQIKKFREGDSFKDG